jgi:hypothetical protein
MKGKRSVRNNKTHQFVSREAAFVAFRRADRKAVGIAKMKATKAAKRLKIAA